MITFIIPAHNEEALLGSCLEAIHRAMSALRLDHEVIVVDDSSTDDTARIARQHEARLLPVAFRQIAATRNAGARQARGEVLFFVDADTQVNEPVLKSAVTAVSEGAVGGGCIPRFDGKLPLWVHLLYPLFLMGMRLLRQPGGSCLFCTRDSFEAIEGFSEAHYAAEDALFVNALKRQGRFVIASGRVITSGRNLRAHSFGTFLRLALRFLWRGTAGFRDRRGLDMWYRPLRERSKP
jgi:glycosyltransferase involved in cell wall biosynthesis